MNRGEAWALAASESSHDRLKGARFLAGNASPDDLRDLSELLATENVSWIIAALKQAVRRAKGELVMVGPSPVPDADEDREISEELRAQVIEETTKQLVHELRPLIAGARYHAAKETSQYERSETKVQLDRLAKLVDTLDELSRASSSPTIQDFDLAELIKSIGEGERRGHETDIAYAGPDPFVVRGDEAMLGMIVRNGLRNAIEATESFTDAASHEIVLNWNETDREYWVAILDSGPGPPHGFDRAFDIGSSTKGGDNLGMGLALARRAIESLSGSIALTPRTEAGGARLEFRWPQVELQN